jgi:hypothetical protein
MYMHIMPKKLPKQGVEINSEYDRLVSTRGIKSVLTKGYALYALYCDGWSYWRVSLCPSFDPRLWLISTRLIHHHHHHHRRLVLRIRLLGLFRFKIYFLKCMNLFGQLVGLLGRGIGRPQGLYLHRTTRYIKTITYIRASSGIRTHEPSVRTAEDSTCLRLLGHWDRPLINTIVFKYNCEEKDGANDAWNFFPASFVSLPLLKHV